MTIAPRSNGGPAPPMVADERGSEHVSPLLEARGLARIYPHRLGPACGRCVERTAPASIHDPGSNICPTCRAVVALGGVDLRLFPGEVLGIMGESGSGKSTLLRLLHLVERPSAGTLRFRAPPGAGRVEPTDLLALNAAQARRFRGKTIGFVHQNSRQGLSFGISAGGNIAERILISGRRHYGQIRRRATDLLERTGVPPARMDDLPGIFSGGMQQRVQIARALATEPALLLLDEVTTGLDLSVQARILDLILELHRTLGLSMLVVTHDLGVVKLLASQTIVMRHGRVVEAGLTDQILEDPQHPYTQELISAAL